MKERIESVKSAMARKTVIVGGCCGAPSFGAGVGGCGGGIPMQMMTGKAMTGHYPYGYGAYPYYPPYWGSNVPNLYPYSQVIPNLPAYTSMWPYSTPYRPLMRLGQWM